MCWRWGRALGDQQPIEPLSQSPDSDWVKGAPTDVSVFRHRGSLAQWFVPVHPGEREDVAGHLWGLFIQMQRGERFAVCSREMPECP